MIAGWIFGVATVGAVALALLAESWWHRRQSWKRLERATKTEIPRRYTDAEIDGIIAKHNPVPRDYPKPMMRP